MPNRHPPRRCRGNWAEAEKAVGEGSHFSQTREGSKTEGAAGLSCRGTHCHSHLSPTCLSGPESLQEESVQIQAVDISVGRSPPPWGLGAEGPGHWGDRLPIVQAPLRNEDTSTTWTCNRSAHEPLIHYEPRGREIRQKYSTSLILGR